METLNRSELRKIIMTVLYQITVYEKEKITYDIEDVLKENLEIDNEFVKEVVYGVTTYKNELDKKANQYMKNWTVDRLGNTDIAILRMGIYELLYTQTPGIVVINEALELSKLYSDEEISKLVNAVLDKIYHENNE